jgi:small GTP-binding protein
MSLVDDVSVGNSFNGNENDEASLKNCYRLVILGDPRVGKTCIINWFLAKSMNDGYIPTIEDFHRKIFKIKGEIYRLDILDTSGNDPFPAMKKLNIMTGTYLFIEKL